MTIGGNFQTDIFRPLPIVRNSERGDFKQCPAKWNWRWNMGLVPKMPKYDARWFGTLWHLLWATVYKPPGKDGFVRSIAKPSEIHELWDELVKNIHSSVSGVGYFDENMDYEFWEASKLGHFMIDGQLREWNLDPAWEVLMPEQRFSANVPFNRRQQEIPLAYWSQLGYPRGANSGGFIAKLAGTFDLPILDHSSGKPVPMIVDWKTTNKRQTMKQWNKDDQMGTYISIATQFLRAKGYITKDMAVEYMTFSFARKAMPPDPEKVDDQGRIRNKPTKKHFVEALLNSPKSTFGMDELQSFSLSALQEIASEAELKVHGEVSKSQGSALFWRDIVRRNKANRLRQMARIADDVQAMAAVRAGLQPILKSPDDHCNWCDYSDLCDIDEDGGDTKGFIKDVFKVDDPYADHRKDAINSKDYEQSKSS